MRAGSGKRWRSRAAIVLAATSLVATTVVAIPGHATTDTRAWLGGLDGGVFTAGGAAFRGSRGGTPLASAYIAIAGRPSGNGYWLATLAGDVYPFGDAPTLGSLHGKHLNQPIVDMVTTPSGNGYWLVAADGGVFTFGDAHFRGSLGGHPLNKPIGGMVPTPSGGYWLVAEDGGVFTFGDAHFHGSLGGTHLTAPVAASDERRWRLLALAARRSRHAVRECRAPRRRDGRERDRGRHRSDTLRRGLLGRVQQRCRSTIRRREQRPSVTDQHALPDDRHRDADRVVVGLRADVHRSHLRVGETEARVANVGRSASSRVDVRRRAE
jgi:hypothetical protein